MTAICGGGASESKPGFNQTVVVTGAAIEGALIVFGLEIVAAIIGPLLAGTVYDLTQFCTVDPPATPTITAGDLLDVQNWADPTVSGPALNKFKTWFESWYWYQVCQCTTATTPAAPTLTAPSLGQNTGLPSSGLSGPCWDRTMSVLNINSASIDLRPLAPTNQSSPGQNVQFLLPQPVPAELRLVVTVLADGTSQGSCTPVLASAIDAAHISTTPRQVGSTVTPGTTQTFSVTPASTDTVGFIGFSFGGTTFNNHDTLRFEMFCSGQSAITPDSPCCPPDPMLETRLAQIQGMLAAILSSLPTPISSYAEGTVHSGLSGNGSVVLVGAALAIKVEVTTQPGYIGEAAGDPVRLFDLGYVTTITAEAPQTTSRILYASQLIALPQLTEAIGYSLNAGVVIRITEITRGP